MVKFYVFTSGLLLMALEIATGRLLVPYYGDGVTVWGSIIGVLLCALALGYYIGGYIADRDFFEKYERHIFPSLFFVSGLLILPIPFVIKTLSSLHILFITFLLLTLPSVALGIISPLVMKKATHSLNELGITAGTVYTLGTLGSIVGTFGTVFFLFTHFLIQDIFVLLALVSGIAALFSKSFGKYVGFVLVIISFSLFTPGEYANLEAGVVLPSAYGEVKVNDLEGHRFLSINGGLMSEVNLKDRTERIQHWDYLHCLEAPFISEQLEKPKVLTIGLGAGYFQNFVHEVYGAEVDAVELNPVVIEVAKKYFAYDLAAHEGDGRLYLSESEEKYDVISLDVMHFTEHAYRVPLQFSTVEFFKEAQAKLSENGFFSFHIPTKDTEDPYFVDIFTTLNTVFPEVKHYSCNSGQVLVAGDKKVNAPELSKYLNQKNIAEGKVLTDSFIPFN